MLNGASEGIRTLDIHLGKVTLYQAELRSLPNNGRNSMQYACDCKSSFWPEKNRKKRLYCELRLHLAG
jgi:hypothetical protein